MRLHCSRKLGAVYCFGFIMSFAALLTISSVGARLAKAKRDDPGMWTLAQWITWRDKQITHILEPTFDPHDGTGDKLLTPNKVYNRCLEAYTFVEPCLQKDPQFFTADPGRAQALGNFMRFIKAQHWIAIAANPPGKAPYGLDMEVPDEQYWTITAPYVNFPDLLKSQEFLTKMASPNTYKAALAMIEQHNASLPTEQKWIPILFNAQFITTVDAAHTYGRLLVVVPNEPFGSSGVVDRWISFGIATPDMNPVPEMRSVSMFTIYRSAATPDKTQTFFSDFMRIKDQQTGQITITSNFIMKDDPSHNCYNCHKSSVIPIHPEIEYDFDAGGKLVEKTTNVGILPAKVNNFVMGYGQPDYGYQDTGAYGPCIGPANKVRTDEFIKSATIGLNISQSSYDNIRNAMRCSNCHSIFADINYPQAVRTDLDAVAFKTHKGMVQTYIEKGYMPPGNNLSAEERQGLWRCLIKEYYDLTSQQGLFVDWLKGGSSGPSPMLKFRRPP